MAPPRSGRNSGGGEQHSGSASGSGAAHSAPGLDAILYQTDAFRIKFHKILQCSNKERHDWHECPFAHPGERARRRPLDKFSYSSEMCPAVRGGAPCPQGDECPFSHHAFEAWLHPAKYRTKICADGAACARKVCFFAHSESELRAVPAGADGGASAGGASCGSASMSAGASMGAAPGAVSGSGGSGQFGPVSQSRSSGGGGDATGQQRRRRPPQAQQHQNSGGGSGGSGALAARMALLSATADPMAFFAAPPATAPPPWAPAGASRSGSGSGGGAARVAAAPQQGAGGGGGVSIESAVAAQLAAGESLLQMLQARRQAAPARSAAAAAAQPPLQQMQHLQLQQAAPVAVYPHPSEPPSLLPVFAAAPGFAPAAAGGGGLQMLLGGGDMAAAHQQQQQQQQQQLQQQWSHHSGGSGGNPSPGNSGLLWGIPGPWPPGGAQALPRARRRAARRAGAAAGEGAPPPGGADPAAEAAAAAAEASQAPVDLAPGFGGAGGAGGGGAGSGAAADSAVGSAGGAAAAAAAPRLDLGRAARRFETLSAVLGVTGACLVLCPDQFFHALMVQPPTGLEMLFLRTVGAATLFKAALAHILQDAAESGQLGSTTPQRIMLGLVLRGVSNLMAFKQIASCWAAFQYPLVLFGFPLLVMYTFIVNLLAFEPYNPYFLVKMVWPVALGMVLAHLAPHNLGLPQQLHADAPAWLKGGVLAGALPAKAARSAAAAAKAARVAAKVAPKVLKTQIINRSYALAMPQDAHPTMIKTVAGKMDFTAPVTRLGWIYWALMLADFTAMFHALTPQALFVGDMTPLARVLKMTWSAAFLIAAFCCDALKTAAERGTLALRCNRRLNLCLGVFEVGFAVCLVNGIGQGAVLPGRGWARVATAAAAGGFFLRQFLKARSEVEEEGFEERSEEELLSESQEDAPGGGGGAEADGAEAAEGRPRGILSTVAATALAAITVLV
ncbi:MAG: hypothetical protein J3K34DRAFT_522149 [Monoraphidium minutum]|nr:MAG: hypothetical protein J3K34DRAFT_522149 [Monoraphidium minutum]